MVAWPLRDSVLLSYHFDRDTRAIAQTWLEERNATAICERYSVNQFRPDRQRVRCAAKFTVEDLNNSDADYLVLSSFQYGRFLEGIQMSGQTNYVYSKGRRYEKLFELPYTEIRPAHRSFAFSNPVIRIIDLRRHRLASGGPAGTKGETPVTVTR